MNDTNNSISNALSSTGQPLKPGTHNIYQDFLEIYGDKPCFLNIDIDSNENLLKFEKFEKILKENYTYDKLYEYSFFDMKKLSVDEILFDLKNGIFVHINILDVVDLYSDEELIKMELNKDEEIISNVDVYYKKDIDRNTLIKFTNLLKDSLIKISNIEKSSIEMVSVVNGNLYTEDFYLKDNFLVWSEPDLHYGDGFEKFHKDLLDKIDKKCKGLALFHGEPGTGKTQYIRKLIKDLSKDSRILYFSPNMITSITNPDFINFITEWSIGSEHDIKRKRIIILEDAEPLLENRDNTRNNGITNLLNLTSGLLSDFMNIQYICTFNTSIKNIDQALLREERLTAIKSFKALNKEEAIKLGKHINIEESKIEEFLKNKNDNKFLNKNEKDTITLADIYSIYNKNEIIQHKIDIKERKIGFK
jgi:hypothetical protein